MNDFPWRRHYNEDDIQCDLCRRDIELDYLVKLFSLYERLINLSYVATYVKKLQIHDEKCNPSLF